MANLVGGFLDCDSIELAIGLFSFFFVDCENGSGVLDRPAENWVAAFAVEIVAQMVQSWEDSRCTPMWVIHGSMVHGFTKPSQRDNWH